MKRFILILLFTLPDFVYATPTPFPVFLKTGFSTVLEFDEIPIRVVLGDSQSFQVEKLDHSIVLKCLVPYASGNMFVYFKTKEPRLFVITASEDAEPTYYKKFETPAFSTAKPVKSISKYKRSARVLSAHFTEKKDYLTLEIEITADSVAPVKPNWNLVRVLYNKTAITPYKLWAERQDVQKDSGVKARFIFAKPNVPKNLKNVALVIPTLGSKSFTLELSEKIR